MNSSPGFAQFMAERQRPLLRFATVVTSDARLAEDIVADVLGRAWEKWSRIGAMEQPNAYVRRMIVNDFVSWRRGRARTNPSGDVVALLDESGEQFADYADQHADRDDLIARLRRLPRKQRAVLALRFYEDMSDAEIADVMGCQLSTVRSNIARALATLRIEALEAGPTRGVRSVPQLLAKEI